MILVERRLKGIPYRQKWFARNACAQDLFRVVIYYQYLGRTMPPLFLRRSFATNHISLDRDPESMLDGMRKNVRYEIRRAEGEGLQWEAGFDSREFAAFHESFAQKKGIGGVGFLRIKTFGPALILSRAVKDGRILAQHAHVMDEGESRVRLLYSSSARFDKEDAALAGRANRWCHWKDMMYFRDRGIRVYDFGGVAGSTHNHALHGIDDFKLGFGGTVVHEDHWLSPLYFLASLTGTP